jgi:hypothetical protein
MIRVRAAIAIAEEPTVDEPVVVGAILSLDWRRSVDRTRDRDFAEALSGLIFPVENIPAGLRWLSNLVQAGSYIVVVRDALLQGAGWLAVRRQLPPICAIGLVFYALAWRATRRMQVNA